MSSGGRGRDAKAGPGGGCDPPRPAGPPAPCRRARTPAPPRALPPRASESRSAPQRREVGRGRDSGHCLGGGDRTHPVFPKCPPRPTAGWAAGLGNGAEELPTLQLLEPTRANHLGASIRGRGAGETEAPSRGGPEWVYLLARNSASFLGRNAHWPPPAPPQSDWNGSYHPGGPTNLRRVCSLFFMLHTEEQQRPCPAPGEDNPPGDSCCTEPAPKK